MNDANRASASKPGSDSQPPGRRFTASSHAPVGSTRVHLRELGREGSPLVDSRSPELDLSGLREGRYELAGEIARGGVGAILEARDVSLGRDVAVKVLLTNHARNPVMLRRFVEEAQIGGQLQHPGIAPVYDLGLRPDRRPYFAMKLVRGRTLAAMLQDRSGPDDDRRRFFTVFEQMARTLAYAHDRGVIHRDLKPSNIMVGAFGEVQVMDWGLAKVLGRTGADESPSGSRSQVDTVRTGTPGTESLAGSVMGTPAYMPPEQARGEIDRVDARADVFALGAILCEMLTGDPPYAGRTWAEVHEKAESARLDDARKKIAAVRPDEELAAMVNECLDPDPAARPENARAVAKRFAGYLASAEERAHRAESAVAISRAKAAEARRARRLAQNLTAAEGRRRRIALGLAAAVAAILVLTGGGWAWLSSAASARAEQAAGAVREAFDEEALHRGKAAAGDAEGLEHWARAVAAARRAVDLAAAAQVGDTLRAAADRRLVACEQGERDAREAVADAARDRRIAERIDELALQLPETWVADRTAAEIAALLRRSKLDPARSDTHELAVKARARSLAPLLAGAFDRLAALAVDPAVRRRCESLAAAVDPDERGRDLREAARRADREAIRREAEIAAAEPFDARRVVLAAAALDRIGDGAAAEKLLRAARLQHPESVPVNQSLGARLIRMDPPRWFEAARLFTTVLALRPKSVSARVNLATALDHTGREDEADRLRAEAIGKRPDWKGAIRLDRAGRSSESAGTKPAPAEGGQR